MVTIPKPCNEDWNSMIPTNTGRYCNSCDKVVIDFIEMSNDEILQFLNDKKSVCGHFLSSQAEVPLPIVSRYLHTIKEDITVKFSSKFFRTITLYIIGLLIMLSGCKAPQPKGRIKGKVRMPSRKMEREFKNGTLKFPKSS